MLHHGELPARKINGLCIMLWDELNGYWVAQLPQLVKIFRRYWGTLTFSNVPNVSGHCPPSLRSPIHLVMRWSFHMPCERSVTRRATDLPFVLQKSWGFNKALEVKEGRRWPRHSVPWHFWRYIHSETDLLRACVCSSSKQLQKQTFQLKHGVLHASQSKHQPCEDWL